MVEFQDIATLDKDVDIACDQIVELALLHRRKELVL